MDITNSINELIGGTYMGNIDIIKQFNEICYPHKYVPSVIPKQQRVVAFGDIHGDYDLAVELLFLSKVIDRNLLWIGGKTIVVQVGDQIDSCRPNGKSCSLKETTYNDKASDIKIMELFNNLSIQAIQHGGQVISLIGNHELLNVQGNFMYSSYENMKAFEKYVDPKDPSLKFVSGEHAKRHAFKRGNEYGKMIGCTRMPFIIIGTNIFVHAGIIDKYIEKINIKETQDLENISMKIKLWLIGMLEYENIFELFNNPDNMFWTRVLGNIESNINFDNTNCYQHINKAVELFGMKFGSMIIGHTPQSFFKNESINGTCIENDRPKIIRIDNGSSNAFTPFDTKSIYKYNRRPQVLEIIDDTHFYVIDKNGRNKL
jgi:Icc-related predicted phosphoesterase